MARSRRVTTDESIEQVETDGRDNEQVHNGNIWRVVMQKVRHPWLGGTLRLTMYLATLNGATSNPSLSSSPWMRGAPQNGCLLRNSSRISKSRRADLINPSGMSALLSVFDVRTDRTAFKKSPAAVAAMHWPELEGGKKLSVAGKETGTQWRADRNSESPCGRWRRLGVTGVGGICLRLVKPIAVSPRRSPMAALELPHWLVISGAVLVLAGFIGLVVSGKKEIEPSTAFLPGEASKSEIISPDSETKEVQSISRLPPNLL
jgi:hypothetical protein